MLEYMDFPTYKGRASLKPECLYYADVIGGELPDL